METRRLRVALVIGLGVSAVAPAVVVGDAFGDYALTGSFALPPGAGEFDVLADGRIVTLVGADVYAETAAGGRAFAYQGTLAGMDAGGFGPAFVRVSPDGTKLAVGNNGGATFGNYQIGVFDTAGLSGTWFAAGHYDAA